METKIEKRKEDEMKEKKAANEGTQEKDKRTKRIFFRKIQKNFLFLTSKKNKKKRNERSSNNEINKKERKKERKRTNILLFK